MRVLIDTSAIVAILNRADENHTHALDLMQKASYVDAISFAVMKRFKMSTAFAFDDHFKQFGFKLYSSQIKQGTSRSLIAFPART
ncbi:hypothetical protein MGLY_10800 [Neomoorella glycerini]|uniref:PIN domain-containing protein n=2 Tax=Neomoorella glycerini TaxID=55779 RepID=A0A6I5ZPM6_9FIRM|nr:hypothetical protein MGLY_10800 [Moorella glycerini]